MNAAIVVVVAVLGATARPLGSIQEPLRPAGRFVVQIHQRGVWREAGSLPADRFVREGSLRLPARSATDAVRIVRSGGVVGHLDRVSLDGRAPRAVRGSDGKLGLGKLARVDNDLVDAAFVELDFPATADGALLRVSGRIEDGPRAQKTPFEFPRENQGRPVDARSRFFAVERGLRGWQPLFQEEVLSASGHPLAPVAARTRLGPDGLDVHLDFGPDNTLDGEEDFAAVHLRTQAGIREHRVTVSDRMWGKPRFEYTPLVSWQHKVYDFHLPKEVLREAGPGPIELAVSAYGTASPGEYGPALAWLPWPGQFLLVYERVAPAPAVVTQVLDGSGARVGGETVVGEGYSGSAFPKIAVDTVHGRALLAWNQYPDLHVRLVDPDGNPLTDDIVESTCQDPALVFEPNAGQYFVAFRSNASGFLSDLFGVLLRADGSAVDGAFLIADTGVNGGAPSAAADPVSGRILVAFQAQGAGGTTIRAVLLDGLGHPFDRDGDGTASMTGDAFDLSPGGQNSSPTVAFEPTSSRFLVAWQSQTGTRARLVSPAGQVVDTAAPEGIAVFAEANHYAYPFAVADPIASQFLVGFLRAEPPAGSFLWGKLVKASDATVSDATPGPISAHGVNGKPSGAYSRALPGFLLAWQEYVPGAGTLALAVLPGAECAVDAHCDDANPCTVDVCDASSRCAHSPAPVSTACSDGQDCNGAELCDGRGSCSAGTSCQTANPDDGKSGCGCATGASAPLLVAGLLFLGHLRRRRDRPVP